MFEGLTPLSLIKPKSAQERKQDKRVTQARIKTLRIAQQQAASLATLKQNIDTMASGMKDFTHLRLLRTVVNTHGLNRSLMAFVNPKDQGISRVMQNLPSTESFDAVSIRKDDIRVKTALEGMDDTLDTEPSLVADWVRTAADNTDTLLSSTERQMQSIGLSISGCLETLEEAEIEDDDLASCTIEACSQDQVASCLDCLLEVFPDLDAKVSDPTDRDAMDAHQTKMSGLVDKLSTHTGLCFDPDNPHQVRMGDTQDAQNPQSGTLGNLGYTLDNTIALLKKSDAVIDEVHGLIARKQAMVDHFNQTAATVEVLDNDVPPAVHGAISDDEDDPDTGMTQIDVIHCHVSSHLCMMCSAIEAATCAVQTVLSVGYALCRLDDDDDQPGEDNDATDA